MRRRRSPPSSHPPTVMPQTSEHSLGRAVRAKVSTHTPLRDARAGEVTRTFVNPANSGVSMNRKTATQWIVLIVTVFIVIGINLWNIIHERSKKTQEIAYKTTPAGIAEINADSQVRLAEERTKQLPYLVKLARAGVPVSLPDMQDQSSQSSSSIAVTKRITKVSVFECDTPESRDAGFANTLPHRKDVNESVSIVGSGCASVQYLSSPTDIKTTGEYILAVEGSPGEYHKCGTIQMNNDFQLPCLSFLRTYVGHTVRIINKSNASVTIS